MLKPEAPKKSPKSPKDDNPIPFDDDDWREEFWAEILGTVPQGIGDDAEENVSMFCRDYLGTVHRDWLLCCIYIYAKEFCKTQAVGILEPGLPYSIDRVLLDHSIFSFFLVLRSALWERRTTTARPPSVTL